MDLGASPLEGLDLTAELADAFRDRRVLVTGHSGFKGSWLAIWLHRLGARVTGYSLPPPSDPSNFVAAGVRGVLAGHHEADLRDLPRLTAAVRSADPSVVFHLAAQAIVRDSYAQPRETFETNILGTVNLLEAVRSRNEPCVVVVVTSDKCYENRGQVWGYRECDPMGGYDPYSASKGAAEIVTAAYRRSFFPPEQLATHGVQVATARAGNVIGGGDWAKDRILCDAARALAADQPVPVRNPFAIRPWQHVLEPLSGYLTLAARMLRSPDAAWGEAWNFGPRPEDAIPVRQLVEQFVAAWGGGGWVDRSDAAQPHEAAILRLSIDKALARLNWRPRWPVAEAVARTARWYRRFHDRRDESLLAACHEDIAAYEAAS